MDKGDILALMMTQGPVTAEWDTVLACYAECLARVAPKLSDDELYPLLAVGASIYQKWCQNTHAEKATAEAIVRLLGRSD